MGAGLQGLAPSYFLEGIMQVRVERGFYGREGNVVKGRTLDVDDKRATELLRKGLVSKVQAKKDDAEPKKAAGNRKAEG